VRVVLDTNILISALMVQVGNPAAIYRAWQHGHFTLLTCTEHLDELRATLRKPAVATRIKPHRAGRLVNELKKLAKTIGPLPRVQRSPTPRTTFCWLCPKRAKPIIWLRATRPGCLLSTVTKPLGSSLHANLPRSSLELLIRPYLSADEAASSSLSRPFP